jgi:hypothetical protein
MASAASFTAQTSKAADFPYESSGVGELVRWRYDDARLFVREGDP